MDVSASHLAVGFSKFGTSLSHHLAWVVVVARLRLAAVCCGFVVRSLSVLAVFLLAVDSALLLIASMAVFA